MAQPSGKTPASNRGDFGGKGSPETNKICATVPPQDRLWLQQESRWHSAFEAIRNVRALAQCWRRAVTVRAWSRSPKTIRPAGGFPKTFGRRKAAEGLQQFHPNVGWPIICTPPKHCCWPDNRLWRQFRAAQVHPLRHVSAPKTADFLRDPVACRGMTSIFWATSMTATNA